MMLPSSTKQEKEMPGKPRHQQNKRRKRQGNQKERRNMKRRNIEKHTKQEEERETTEGRTLKAWSLEYTVNFKKLPTKSSQCEVQRTSLGHVTQEPIKPAIDNSKFGKIWDILESTWGTCIMLTFAYCAWESCQKCQSSSHVNLGSLLNQNNCKGSH